MSEELVTVATTNNIVEAEFYKNQLEAEGIEVYLADDNIVGTFNLLANAVGGIKVKVPADEAAAAAAYLERLGNSEIIEGEMEAADTGYGNCDQCGSQDLSPHQEALGWKGILLFFGIPLVKPKLRLTCNDCGHEKIEG